MYHSQWTNQEPSTESEKQSMLNTFQQDCFQPSNFPVQEPQIVAPSQTNANHESQSNNNHIQIHNESFSQAQQFNTVDNRQIDSRYKGKPQTVISILSKSKSRSRSRETVPQ